MADTARRAGWALRGIFRLAGLAVLAVLSIVAVLAVPLAWLLRRGPFVLRFGLAYGALSLGLWWAATAGQLTRQPLAAGAPAALHVPALFTVLNRAYVSPEMQAVAHDLAQHMAARHPGTVTVALDGSHPFSRLPLIPHLSHNDGEKLDIALYWTDAAGRYQPGRSRSPIGYWGYAEGPTDCPARLSDLRWDLPWLQRRLPDLRLDHDRTRTALLWLAEDPRVTRVLVEPHILASLGLSHPKLRFQGCRAARHDDHIHFQL